MLQVKSMYPEDYYAYDQEMGLFWETLYNWRCRGEAKRLLKLSSRRPIRLFDIGAGDCRHFRAIGGVGDFEFSGVEMNEKMARSASQAGYNISPGTFEEYDPAPRAGSVDILTMNHLIEHVIDPVETLEKAHTLLADGGIFYGRTPKIHSLGQRLFGRYWGGYHFPRHLHLYSESSLENSLLAAGFRKVEIREDLNLFPALSLQNYLLGKLRVPLQLNAGHTRIWTLLVALTAPLSILDYLLRRGDCMIFIAYK
jgi:SAM-dependent methyltransferase